MFAMKLTSAYANKMIKKLNEDRDFLLEQEKEDRTYIIDKTEAEDKQIIARPEYDYRATSDKLAEINLKIMKLKHAVNINNTVTKMQLKDGTELTIDQALIRMAQLNVRKKRLDVMRAAKPVVKVDDSYGSGYRYLNFDPETVKADFEKISDLIMDIQLQLDYLNQTVEFEVSL